MLLSIQLRNRATSSTTMHAHAPTHPVHPVNATAPAETTTTVPTKSPHQGSHKGSPLICHSYPIHTVLIPHSYCTHTALILHSCCTHTSLMLYSYCTHTPLILKRHPYSTHTQRTQLKGYPYTYAHMVGALVGASVCVWGGGRKLP